MSVRYVWGKYTSTIRYSWDIEGGTETHVPYNLGSDRSWSLSKDRLFGFTEPPELNRDTGKATYTGSYKSMGGTSYSIDTDEYIWCLYATINGASYDGPTGSSTQGTGSGTFTFTPMGRTAGTEDDKCVLMQRRWNNTKWRCATAYSNISAIWVGTKNNGGDTWYDVYIYSAEANDYPDEFIANVSSSSAATYPDFDVDTDGYFYYARDNDIIDPSLVSIPDIVLHNDTITITITESEGAIANKYGTITYDYQYKFGDGAWTDIASTANLTQTLHIPTGTQSVQVRVRAKDDIGFTSTDWITSELVPVYASVPPTAPSFISVDRVVAGWETKVTCGNSTDSDGTIAYYVFERKIDDGSFEQVQSALSQIYTETINTSWSKVQYRVCAVDNSGVHSPYTTSEPYTIESDVIVIVGPSRTDFGAKFGVFNFGVQILLAGEPSTNDVNLTIKLDSEIKHNASVIAGAETTIEIDTSTLEKTEHTIEVTASKAGYTTVSEVYKFRIDGLTVPTNGYIVGLQDSTGKDIVPVVTAQSTVMNDGRDLETVIQEILSQLSSLQG